MARALAAATRNRRQRDDPGNRRDDDAPGTGGSSATSQTSQRRRIPGTGGSSPGTGGSSGTSGGGGGTSACTGVELTVHNIATWCSVTVNGGTASTAVTQTVCIDTAGAVPLIAATTPGFVLSDTMWHHVDDSTGDTGVSGMQNGAKTQSSETKTVGSSGTACAWVCCPGMGNPTECDVGFGAFVRDVPDPASDRQADLSFSIRSLPITI